MSATDLLRRLVFFVVPLLGVAAVWLLPPRPVPPGLAFVLLAAYAHAAARLLRTSGLEKALLFAELMPFYGFSLVQLSLESVPGAVLSLLSALAWGAVLLTIEFLWIQRNPTFTSSACFLAASAAVGAGITYLSAVPFLGAGLAVLTFASYGLARRGLA